MKTNFQTFYDTILFDLLRGYGVEELTGRIDQWARLEA
jgi:hypothetical protein